MLSSFKFREQADLISLVNNKKKINAEAKYN